MGETTRHSRIGRVMAIKLCFYNRSVGQREFLERLGELALEWAVKIEPIIADNESDKTVLMRLIGATEELEPVTVKNSKLGR